MKKRVRVKPSKGQSIFGGVVGVVFCLIGIFAVIPTFGIFGVLWTLIAVGMTAVNFYNGFSDKGIATHEITVGEEEANVATKQPAHIQAPEDRLETIKTLYENGDITYAEYEEKRKQIISEI